MPKPPYPKGYSDWQKVFSGIVEGEPKGLLPNKNPIIAMGYMHQIDRLVLLNSSPFGGADKFEGLWTIQVRDGDDSNGSILFDQSILFGIQTVSEFSGLVGFWYPILYNGSSQGKAKTRNVGGVFLSPIIEPYPPGQVKPSYSKSDLPPNPGVVYFHTQKQASITLRTPPLPERTDYYKITINNTDGNRFGTYVVQPDNYGPNQDLVIDVTAHGPNVVEKTWVKLIGVNSFGETVGEAVRDMWTHISPDGQSLDSGYEGYKYVDSKYASGFNAEDSFTENIGAMDGSFVIDISCDWIGAPYLFPNPITVGSHLYVKSDYWIGMYQDDQSYFSISFREGGAQPQVLYDDRAGELWIFSKRSDSLINSRSRRLNRFGFSEDENILSTKSYSNGFPLRVEPTLWYVAHAGGIIDVFHSVDEGINWDSFMAVVSGVSPYGVVASKDGSTIVMLAKATAADIEQNIPTDAIIAVTAKFSSNSSSVLVKKEQCTGDIPPSTNFLGLFNYGTTFNALVKDQDDVRFFVSTDGCVTWKEITNGN